MDAKIIKVCSCSTAKPTDTHRHQARISITRNSVWIRLEIDKHNDIPILIDTGAGIRIIRQDFVELWKTHHSDKMTIVQESLEAETCDRSPL